MSRSEEQTGKFRSFGDRKLWDGIPASQVTVRPLEEGVVNKWYQADFLISNILIIRMLYKRFIALNRETKSYGGTNTQILRTTAADSRRRQIDAPRKALRAIRLHLHLRRRLRQGQDAKSTRSSRDECRLRPIASGAATTVDTHQKTEGEKN